MKLVRYGAPGMEKPGVIGADGEIRDLSGIIPDIDSHFLATKGIQSLADVAIHTLPVIERTPRIGPCVGKVGKIVCAGLNYLDHAREAGATAPAEPILFLKPASSICGPYDNVELPIDGTKTDWEVELAVVIGTRAKYIKEDNALDYVAGFCILNDVSERSFQLERGGQWDKGKAHDTFAPMGPWLVTRDEIADPHALSLWLEVNGTRYQDGSTSDMIFSLSKLIAYSSQFMTLEPGDVITTGTPAGVGMGQTPPRYLKDGDIMRLGIQELGVQELRCVQLA